MAEGQLVRNMPTYILEQINMFHYRSYKSYEGYGKFVDLLRSRHIVQTQLHGRQQRGLQIPLCASNTASKVSALQQWISSYLPSSLSITTVQQCQARVGSNIMSMISDTDTMVEHMQED